MFKRGQNIEQSHIINQISIVKCNICCIRQSDVTRIFFQFWLSYFVNEKLINEEIFICYINNICITLTSLILL